MKNKCDVLVLLWGMKGRGPEALIPIIFLLREKYSLNVIVRNQFDHIAIDLYKPKILLSNGCTGSFQTARMTKYAKDRGVYVVSLHGEGMIRKSNLESAIIGWNETRIPTVNKWYLWNDDSYSWAIDKYPQFKKVLDVAGSTLHEKYKIFKKEDFKNILLDYKEYEKIVLYSGWGFDKVVKQVNGSKKENVVFYRQRVIQYLESAIKSLPDTLFILKQHPGVIDPENSEIIGSFTENRNVLILKDEIPFYQLLLKSDLVVAFDSTTLIDSWLSNKTTISLYDGKKTIYDDDSLGYIELRNGSLVPDTEEKYLMYLNKILDGKKIDEFEGKKEFRNEIIRKYIGDIDSMPSVKVAEHIYNSLKENNPVVKGIDIYLIISGIMNRFFYFFKKIPVKSKFAGMRKHNKPEAFLMQYKQFQDKLFRYYKMK